MKSRRVDIANPIHIKWATIYSTLELSVSLFVSFLINISVISGTGLFIVGLLMLN